MYSVSDVKKAFQDIANLGIVDPFYPSQLASKLSSWYPKGNVSISSYYTDVTAFSTATIIDDANLIPGNIRESVNILGVVGTLKEITLSLPDLLEGNITSFSYNSVYSLASFIFYNHTNLTNITFPNCSYIGSYAFKNCYNLNTASFPTCNYIDSYAFQSCSRLLSLYLMSTQIPSLTNSEVFMSTPISNFTTYTSGVYGSIYVLSSMLNSWKTATNWSYFSSRFVGV